MDIEIWKDVLDYEGLYQASNFGFIKSIKFKKEKILKPKADKNGYLFVGLYKNGSRKTKWVSRLVYESFNGKTILQIDHIIEGNPQNNRLDNLQALTQRNNIVKNRLTLNKSSKYVGVSFHRPSNTWASRIQINGFVKHLGYHKTELEASNAY